MDDGSIGCFGSILVFDRHDLCSGCHLVNACEVRVAQARIEIDAYLQRETVPETSALKVAVKARAMKRKQAFSAPVVPAPTPAPAITPIVNAMNKKARERLQQWQRRGVNLKELLRGINPLVSTGTNDSAFMEIVLREKSFTRKEMIEHWQQARAQKGIPPWTDGTISSQFLINSEILLAEGIIDLVNGTYAIRSTT